MLAIGLLRNKVGVYPFDVPKPEIRQDDEVLVKVKEAGVDGTDFSMVRYSLQDFPEGDNQIVMGHEMVGVVEEVGAKVKTVKPGDTVIWTVRRGCDGCTPCRRHQSDMCTTGLYTERGIHKLHGCFTEYVVERENYVIKVPKKLAGVAVFTEALSIVEKGIEQLRAVQARLPWSCAHPQHGYQSPDWGQCKVALVLGAGPLGLLATARLRLAGVRVFTADVVPSGSPKARLAASLDAAYLDVSGRQPDDVVEHCCQAAGKLDIIFEASGAAIAALEYLHALPAGGIYVMTGIPRPNAAIRVDAAQLARNIALYDQAVVGSVNANRGHFQQALKDIPAINSSFPGLLEEMITHRFHLDEYRAIFDLSKDSRIKTVIDVAETP